MALLSVCLSVFSLSTCLPVLTLLLVAVFVLGDVPLDLNTHLMLHLKILCDQNAGTLYIQLLLTMYITACFCDGSMRVWHIAEELQTLDLQASHFNLINEWSFIDLPVSLLLTWTWFVCESAYPFSSLGVSFAAKRDTSIVLDGSSIKWSDSFAQMFFFSPPQSAWQSQQWTVSVWATPTECLRQCICTLCDLHLVMCAISHLEIHEMSFKCALFIFFHV